MCAAAAPGRAKRKRSRRKIWWDALTRWCSPGVQCLVWRAADGVAAALSAQGIGLQLRAGSPAIPIVPCAVLHDLGNGGDKNWGLSPPYRDLGLRACGAAQGDFALGSVRCRARRAGGNAQRRHRLRLAGL